MPTIEIVSIGADKLGLDLNDFDIAIIEENKLISHRGLFYNFLKNQNGIIVHIGNPEFKSEKIGIFFAGQIIDWDFEPGYIEIPDFDKGETGSNQNFRFKFLLDYQIEIAKIINIGFQKSPTKDLYFLTDYQFGPETAITKEIYVKDFWIQHDNEGLEWNVLYKLIE
jgi:hypothetical protein